MTTSPGNPALMSLDPLTHPTLLSASPDHGGVSIARHCDVTLAMSSSGPISPRISFCRHEYLVRPSPALATEIQTPHGHRKDPVSDDGGTDPHGSRGRPPHPRDRIHRYCPHLILLLFDRLSLANKQQFFLKHHTLTSLLDVF